MTIKLQYSTGAGQTAPDAFVRMIASTDWQGTNLTTTHHEAVLSDLHPKGNQAIDLAPTTPVRVYEVTGTYPTFLVPALESSTDADADAVSSPLRLAIAVTEDVPVRMVSLTAFPS